MSSKKEDQAVPVDPLIANPEEEEERLRKKRKEGEKETKAPMGKNKKEKEKMSEEDLALKEKLELLVTTVGDDDFKLASAAAEQLCAEVRSSTSSVTSVPKALKFLRPFYEELKNTFEKTEKSGNDTTLIRLADVLSVLAMSFSEKTEREALHFKLKGNTKDVGEWGTEFARHLAGEIGVEFNERMENGDDVADLIMLVEQLVPYNMEHHAEPEACDLLYEVDQLSMVERFVKEENYARVALYLLTFSSLVAEPDDAMILNVALNIYKKFGQLTDALRIALKLGDVDRAKDIFLNAPTKSLRAQMAYIFGRHHLFILDDEEDKIEDEDERDELIAKINNSHLSTAFLDLGAELNVLAPKTPEQIFEKPGKKDKTKTSKMGVDSARTNLAATFVNAFVNAGFGDDTLMTLSDQNAGASAWIHKNKEHGMMSAAASLGMILLWDVDGGLSQIDALLEYTGEDFVKAGALLSVGVLNSGVRHEVDPAMALLSEHVDATSDIVRIGAILGLGLAYAGSAREDVTELIMPTIEDSKVSMHVASIAALAVGLVFCGSGNGEIAETLVDELMERGDVAIKKETHSRFYALGIGLIFLGRQAEVDVTLMAVASCVPNPYFQLTIDACAYAGTGNVLKVQELLHVLADTDQEEEERSHHTLAVLAIGMIAMGEEIGVHMARRTFEHLIYYGDPLVRRGVPLALALTYVSNPDVGVVDTLSRMSHDQTADVAHAAILGLGLVGAGTNNSRVGGILHSLAEFHEKEPAHLFLVRIAQGLLHFGKGLLTLSPFHSHGLLMSRVAVAGLFVVLHAALDMKNILLDKSHYLFYVIVSALWPRMLMTYNEAGEQINVPVRVGRAVDTIGQAGKPKTISGFQTHSTPVLLAAGDRAELAGEDYLASTSAVLEDFVILTPNPDAPPKTKHQKDVEAKEQAERVANRLKALAKRNV